MNRLLHLSKSRSARAVLAAACLALAAAAIPAAVLLISGGPGGASVGSGQLLRRSQLTPGGPGPISPGSRGGETPTPVPPNLPVGP